RVRPRARDGGGGIDGDGAHAATSSSVRSGVKSGSSASPVSWPVDARKNTARARGERGETRVWRRLGAADGDDLDAGLTQADEDVRRPVGDVERHVHAAGL